jgi:hypothetical protein
LYHGQLEWVRAIHADGYHPARDAAAYNASQIIRTKLIVILQSQSEPVT